MKRLLILLCFPLLLKGQTLTTINYVYDGVINFANPERGMARIWDLDASFTQTNLLNYRNGTNEKVTLLWRIYYLSNFINTDNISSTFLNKIANELQLCRENGFKMIVRFAYTQYAGNFPPPKPYNSEPDLPRILLHLNQLKPILIQNKDVIANFHAGFIGYWGEWFYSDNFNYSDNSLNYPKRRQLMDAIFESFADTERMVSLRTPHYKTNMYSLNYTNGHVLSNEAFTNIYKAKIGYSNDCMYYGYQDGGTYLFADSVVAKNYLANDTKFVIMGGEHCTTVNSTLNSCTNVTMDLRNLHYSFVNAGGDAYKSGIQQWINEGCYSDIVKNLGYRFHLEQAQFTPNVRQGDSLKVILRIKNYGYAGIFNPRMIVLKLRNKANNQITDFVYSSDARKLLPLGGETNSNILKFKIPSNFQTCDYDILLQFSDPYSSLNITSNAKFYSIRLATKSQNSTDLWDNTSGIHNLNATVKICPSTIESIGSGDWTNANTWSCGCIPTPNDNVVIHINHKIIISNSTPKIQIKNLLVEKGAVFDVKSIFITESITN